MKNKLYKAMAAVFALTIMAASPAATMDAHAWGFNENAVDTTEREEMPDNYWNQWDDTNDSGSDYNEPETECTAPTIVDRGSSNEGGGASYIESSSNNASSSAAVAATGNTVKKTADNVTVNVTGGQKFRIVTSADYMAYQIYHCGISQASFAVTDVDGNAVAFSSVKLEKGEDGLWYLNISFAEGVDTKDFTVTVTKGDASYLATKLGVSGIKINGTVALSTVSATDTK